MSLCLCMSLYMYASCALYFSDNDCRNLPYDGHAGEKQKCVSQKENVWESPPTFI